MGLVAIEPVFGVSEYVISKPACSATETSQSVESSLVASLEMILSDKGITKVLIRLPECAGWSVSLLFANPKDRFSCVGAYILTDHQKSMYGSLLLIKL